ncbi:Uncharacterized membrane protein YkvI [Pelagirhabdus alkalitolerans]|uniref:Uncharacterized membrane protein YkvI n=1 Tax=Pelagirhabdus alkalitolerans TaxID=1612202 RepID=A0A1G6LC63_9BACI|nr:hypothetical protein [Pelagirhabdus alkalitolerans]SDC40869.1 Uncharacterized membrane protein YkvI [Pelagirhabdus alkalitolerans]
MKTSFKWISLIIGTMIGAGFASGREIWQFFNGGSTIGIILFVGLFYLSCYRLMLLSYQKQTTHYNTLLKIIVGRRISDIYDYLIMIYLFSMITVMIAGSGAVFEAMGLSYRLGALVLAVIIVVVLWGKLSTFLTINVVILPILISGLATILAVFVLNRPLPMIKIIPSIVDTRTFFFTALNILPLMSIIATVGDQIKQKREVHLTSLISSLILGSMIILYDVALYHIGDFMDTYQMPVYLILESFEPYVRVFMSTLLWLAIVTTAIGGMTSLLARFTAQGHETYYAWLCCLVLLMLSLSQIGFTSLVRYVYPAYGVINIYLLYQLMIFPLKKDAKAKIHDKIREG